MEAALEDEIVSINAIYSDSTLEILSQNPTICSLLLPGDDSISLRLEFPDTYPDAPPSILGTQSVGEHVGKGEGRHVVELSRNVLAEIYQPGSPCIFDLVEEVNARLQQYAEDGSQAQGVQEQQALERNGQQQDAVPSKHAEPDESQPLEVLDSEPPWILSDVFTEKKSVFVARAAAVSSPAEAKSFLHHLLATDKKVAKATHNITAWRILGANDTSFQDCDDDGETAAGGRVLHLMQLMDVWGVMVVITRWYGGVQLGPDRFRIINSAARDAFVKGGYVKEAGKDIKPEGGKKKGKK
ncbi:hypothetical protein MBLNU459_g1578t1 [Dothideomycetes sp. NU459]